MEDMEFWLIAKESALEARLAEKQPVKVRLELEGQLSGIRYALDLIQKTKWRNP